MTRGLYEPGWLKQNVFQNAVSRRYWCLCGASAAGNASCKGLGLGSVSYVVCALNTGP